MEENNNEVVEEVTTNKKNNKPIIYGLIGLAVVLIVVGVCFTFGVFGGDKKEDNKDNQKNNKEIVNKAIINLDVKNDYYLSYKLSYFKDNNSFIINNKDDIYNLYYNIINMGYDEFSFYCSFSYKSCSNDVQSLSEDAKKLSIINDFVHPYNSFDTLENIISMQKLPSFFSLFTNVKKLVKITVKINKEYSLEKIEKLNNKIEEVVKEQVKNEKDEKKIIRIIHDYIINNTKYDRYRSDKGIVYYQSNNAYGVLFEGYGVCSGYTDAMALFLNYFNIPNFKVASGDYIWNAVFVDGKWLHLDLTWDDPLLSNGEDIIDDSYFLITNEELRNLNDSQHYFDELIYKELKN